MTFTFEGFDPANTTPVPDIFFDVLLPHLNEAQLKVMLYIIRRTLGFKKTEDAISLKQFRFGIVTRDKKQLDEGCGLKNFTTISKALKSLEAMNCVEKVPSKTDAGDDATTVYRIHFRGTARNVVPTTDNVVRDYANRSTGTAPSGVGVLRETESQLNSNTRNSLQETVRQESIVTSAIAGSDAPALFAFQVQNFPLHFYHDFCIHAQDRGINDGLVLIVRNLADVPQDAECDICYKPVHGPHGYYEIGVDAAPAATIHDIEVARQRKTDPRIPAVSSHSHEDIGNDDDEDISLAETTKHTAVKKPDAGTRTSVVNPPVGDQDDSTSGQAHSVSPSGDAAQRTVRAIGAVQASIPKRPRSRKPLVLPDEQPTPKSDTREIQRRINEHRGYQLEEQVEIIRERKAIKTWCNLHTLEEYGLVMSGAKNDKYWGKAENYYRIGGLTLLKITPEILARQRQPLPMAANGNGHQSDMEGLIYQDGLVLWQGQWMTEEEADKTGYNGGFGLYK